MFNKYIINDNTSAIAAARITAESNDRLGRKLESISQAEIKSKDRVDISLEEYERMQKKIEYLEQENRAMGNVLRTLGFPTEIVERIVTNSIEVVSSEYCEDPISFKRRYYIKFDVYEDDGEITTWRARM